MPGTFSLPRQRQLPRKSKSNVRWMKSKVPAKAKKKFKVPAQPRKLKLKSRDGFQNAPGNTPTLGADPQTATDGLSDSPGNENATNSNANGNSNGRNDGTSGSSSPTSTAATATTDRNHQTVTATSKVPPGRLGMGGMNRQPKKKVPAKRRLKIRVSKKTEELATPKHKPKLLNAHLKIGEIPTTNQGVVNKLVSQLLSFVDNKRRQFDQLSFKQAAKAKELYKLTHEMYALMGHVEALGYEAHSDFVASHELLDILVDKEETLGLKFPQSWHPSEEDAAQMPQTERAEVSPTANSFTVNEGISRRSLFCRNKGLDKLQKELVAHEKAAARLAHNIRQYTHMRTRLYKSSVESKRAVKHLEEYIRKLRSKDNQLDKAIVGEEQKFTSVQLKMVKDAETRKAVLKEHQEKVNLARLTVAASNSIHMLAVSQAQLKKNVELKMVGDLDEAAEKRLNQKYTKSVAIRKMQQLKTIDDKDTEAKFHHALRELGLEVSVCVEMTRLWCMCRGW